MRVIYLRWSWRTCLCIYNQRCERVNPSITYYNDPLVLALLQYQPLLQFAAENTPFGSWYCYRYTSQRFITTRFQRPLRGIWFVVGLIVVKGAFSYNCAVYWNRHLRWWNNELYLRQPSTLYAWCDCEYRLSIPRHHRVRGLFWISPLIHYRS